MGPPDSQRKTRIKHEKTREKSVIGDQILAPCSAFSAKDEKWSLSALLRRKALQGAGIQCEKPRENTEIHGKVRKEEQIQAAPLVPWPGSEQKLTSLTSGQNSTTGCGDSITENTRKPGKVNKTRPGNCSWGTRLSSM